MLIGGGREDLLLPPALHRAGRHGSAVGIHGGEFRQPECGFWGQIAPQLCGFIGEKWRPEGPAREWVQGADAVQGRGEVHAGVEQLQRSRLRRVLLHLPGQRDAGTSNASKVSFYHTPNPQKCIFITLPLPDRICLVISRIAWY
jgi:hypothetical protein